MHHTIEVHDLHFSYPDGRTALKGVHLYVSPGEKVALVGPNGAGKSTLMLHLNGVLRDHNAITVCGLPIDDANLARVRKAVGLVFQDPDDQLFSSSVYDDVAFGPLYMGLHKPEVDRRVGQALGAVGLVEYEERVSHHLSNGEKKRVAIATVLAMDPEILVLDEPTAGLDPRARRGLITLIRELPQTMLVSTHDMRMVAELFKRTIVLDEGCVVFDGDTQHLLSDEGFLEKHGLEAP